MNRSQYGNNNNRLNDSNYHSIFRNGFRIELDDDEYKEYLDEFNNEDSSSSLLTNRITKNTRSNL